MAQTFRVSHADLYRQPARGVTVQVPVGTRQIRLVPSASACPVEVHADMVPPDARVQDGQLVHSPGETLYPGDSLLLAEGCTSVQVRLPPSLNGGAIAWVADAAGTEPFGEDANRPRWYGSNALGDGDIIYGPAPTTDGLAAGIADSVLTFVASRELQLHAGTGLSTLPHTLRVPGSYQVTNGKPNATNRASVTNSLEQAAPSTPTIVAVIAPWHVVTFGILARFQRVRLRVSVTRAWIPSLTTQHRVGRLVPFTYGPLAQLLPTSIDLGSYAPRTDNGRSARTGTVLEIDLGTPSELFSLLAGSPDQTVATLQWTAPGGLDPVYGPKCSVEWLFDTAPSSPGRFTSTSTESFSVSGGATHGVACNSPSGSVVQLRVTLNSAADAELRVWSDKWGSGTYFDVATAPDFAAPVPVTGAGEQPLVILPLPVGRWYVGLYSGSGAVSGQLRQEG